MAAATPQRIGAGEAMADAHPRNLVAITPKRRPPRVVAMLQVYNERRFLAACIEHLREQGVGVYVIDNESTDETLAIAERYLDRGVIGIETAPRHGVFALRTQCERQEDLACTLDADWLVHHDADEFRVSPKRGQTLRDAIAEIDEAGFNAVNFLEFVFVPTREFPDHDHAAFRRTMRWYYSFLPSFPHRVNAWKRRDERVDLQSSAGHVVHFAGQRLAPRSLYMRHYLYVSMEHACEKFVRRRFAPAELADGWFRMREGMTEEMITFPSVSDLRVYTGDHLLDPSKPLRRHLLDPASRSNTDQVSKGVSVDRRGSSPSSASRRDHGSTTTKLVVTLASGRETEFEVDTDRDEPACFLLSIPKCGSTLLTKIGQALAQANGVNFVNATEHFVAQNVTFHEYGTDPAMTSILRRGNAYGGYRAAPVGYFDHPVFIEGPKILLVRDPRDALVSQYFWHAYGQPIPDVWGTDGVARNRLENRRSALESDIDTWVIGRAPRIAHTFQGYFPLLGCSTLRVLRYEDYVFEKAKLIALVADHFGWEADAELVRQILGSVDVRPAAEDTTVHVRRVTPGDHLEKLRPDTIDALNEILAPVMEPFDYVPAS